MGAWERLKAWLGGDAAPDGRRRDPELEDVRRRQAEAARRIDRERWARRRRIDATADSWRREDG